MSSFRVRPPTWLLLGMALGACRHHSDAVSLAPSTSVWPRDEHCWWTAVRTTLPVDTVGRRFSDAFATVGLTGVVSRRVGDTVLVRGGPTELAAAHPRATYASRLVAYRHGDSTRFRWYWSITPLADQRKTSPDSASVAGRGIGFCGEIGKLVAIHGWAPREPTGEDSIPVWRRLP
jgi:hypothetical protein